VSTSESTRSGFKVPERAGEPWTEDEQCLLLLLDGRGETLDYIAKKVRRSALAVQKRLELLDSPLQTMQRGHEAVARRSLARASRGQDFKRWPMPSRTFSNAFRNVCSVCGRTIPAGIDVHFVAADKLAHSDCF
jgi:hypothetical protein